ncbi:hypothetical protein PSUB009319_16670 [Ralstonia sp. SET104]|nr:hypothetical protein PSUB009319_16670 [Ralstonia sp. SET104]
MLFSPLYFVSLQRRRKSVNRLDQLGLSMDRKFGQLVQVALSRAVLATEYSAPGALRVFWKSASDCPRMAA